MDCCGSNSKEPENKNDKHDSMKKGENNKTRTVFIWVVVSLALVAGFVAWLV